MDHSIFALINMATFMPLPIVDCWTAYFNTFEATPQPRLAWKLSDFWTGELDSVTQGLREQLTRSLLEGKAPEHAPTMATVLARNAKYAATRPRPKLFRENLRHAIQKAVEDMQRTGQLGHHGLDAFIQGQVKANGLPEDVA